MFKFRLFRDPTSDATGAPTVAAAPAPAAPATTSAIVTPSSYGGSSQYKDWQDPYDDPAFKSQANPQPPAAIGGNKTPQPPAAVGEGGIAGQPPQAGQSGTQSSSTATGEPGQAPAEVSKGALSVEDRTYWEKKDPAFKDMPDHPAVAKMSSSYRELEQKYTQGQTYLGAVNQTIEDYKAVLQSGDPAQIAAMVDHFGGEVQFDTRNTETMTKEIQGQYQDVLAIFKALEPEMTAEQAQLVNRALTAYAGQLNGKINTLADKSARKEEIRKEIAKLTGVQTPKIGNPYERYQAPAKENMTTLEREMNDPNFWAYYNEIAPAFKPGGMYHAQGLTAPKAFGTSIDSARFYMNLAKGLWLQKNMPSVLSNHEKSWLQKQSGNGAVTAPPTGGGAVTTTPSNQDPVLAKHARDMEEHMLRRSGGR